MKRAFAYLILMLVAFLPLGYAVPRLKFEPVPKQIATDQSVVLKIRLDWPQAEDPYEITSLEPKLENLELVNQNQSQETGENVSQTLLYEFRPLKTGTAVIYPFEVSYRKSETEAWVPTLIPEQRIKVVSSSPFKLILLLLSSAACVSGAFFASFKVWKFFKDRAAARNTPPSDPKQRVYAKAEESIAAFTSPNAKEKVTYWFGQLRTVVATYYDVPPKAGTSAEVLSFVKAKELPAGEWNEISRLFEQLAEMQFSQQDIPSYELDRLQKTLLQYVRGKIIIGNSNS